ncbi:MAG TPA: hypothetical protein VNO79_09250 [Actinomycetota bacterium]|nr:hypothetical protein [Actinomycetota bacterium]
MESRVWMVRLRRDLLREVPGTLSLEARHLVFTPDDGSGERRIELRAIRRVRRLLGSPVMVVRHDAEEGPERTAFYFVQPPPLRRPDEPRWGARRERRASVRYLAETSAAKKPEIEEWVRAIRRATSAGG